MKPIIKQLTSEEGEPLLSHYRINYNKYGQEVAVPVVDVRDGIAYRLMAMDMDRSNKRSKYTNYNEYHVSQKTKRKYGTPMQSAMS
jgi:hypothetical protein